MSLGYKEIPQWSDPAGGDYEETWRERSVNRREVGRPGLFLKSQCLCGGKNDFLKARTGTNFSTALESRRLRAGHCLLLTSISPLKSQRGFWMKFSFSHKGVECLLSAHQQHTRHNQHSNERYHFCVHRVYTLHHLHNTTPGPRHCESMAYRLQWGTGTAQCCLWLSKLRGSSNLPTIVFL